MAPLADIVAWVEEEVSRYYKFEPQAQAASHLLTSDELREVLDKEASERAGVYITNQGEDIFLGIHFDASIINAIQHQDPRVKLDSGNLDAFCMIIEEVSHFHLMLNRLQKGTDVSRVELESLGEIDKVLLSYIALAQQVNGCQLLPLARKIYDYSYIVAHESQKPVYEKASSVAARFWFRAIDKRLDPLGEEIGRAHV